MIYRTKPSTLITFLRRDSVQLRLPISGALKIILHDRSLISGPDNRGMKIYDAKLCGAANWRARSNLVSNDRSYLNHQHKTLNGNQGPLS